MTKYITLGKFNKNYFFLLGAILIRTFKKFIKGFKPGLKDFGKIYLFNHEPFFVRHPLLKKILQYFSYALIGFILDKIYYRNNNNNIKLSNERTDETVDNSTVELFNDNNTDRIGEINDKKNIGKIFLVILFCFLSQFICDFLDNYKGIVSLKFWPLEYIFLIIFSKKILHRILYKHQKVSMITIIVFCSIIVIIISFLPVTIEYNNIKITDWNVYQILFEIGWYLIPIIIILYLIAMVMDSYSKISFKWLIDIQYITITRIIMYIGILGFIFSVALFFILSNVPCGEYNDENIKSNLNKICQLNDTINFYYDDYRKLSYIEKDTNFYIDIFIVLILYLGASFLNIFFNFMIIKNLDPFYLVPIDSIYYIVIEMIDYFITIGIRKGNVSIKRHVKFAIRLLNNGVGVFLALIFFEIIELHFCGLDHHLRRSIVNRQDLDKQCLLYNNDEADEESKESNL